MVRQLAIGFALPTLMLGFVVFAYKYAAYVPRYQAGFANGTITFVPECLPLAKQLVTEFSERPLTDYHYQIIQARLSKCGEDAGRLRK